MRSTVRPNGAFKLLVVLLYGQYLHMEAMPRSYTRLNSIRKLARSLGTDSKKINRWLMWLEEQGYIESLGWSANRRQCGFKIRRPGNV